MMRTRRRSPRPTAKPIPGLTVNLYVGPTGSTSGQFGRFASVVAEARDANGTGFVRRLELSQESFAKFAYWTNSENRPTAARCIRQRRRALGTGLVERHNHHQYRRRHVPRRRRHRRAADRERGRGTFVEGLLEVSQKPILLPSLTYARVSSSGLATVSGFNFTSPTNGDESTGALMRIEFVATDLDDSGDSTGTNEGFFRVYHGERRATRVAARRLAEQSSLPTRAVDHQLRRLAPGPRLPSTDTRSSSSRSRRTSIRGSGNTLVRHGHRRRPPWRRDVGEHRRDARRGAIRSRRSTTFTSVLQHANVRCYLGGDPHLVAVARTTRRRLHQRADPQGR